MFQVTRKQFQKIVAEATQKLPADILAQLATLEIIIQNAPSPSDYHNNEVPDGEDLFGLFEGIPLTERAHGDQMTTPNLITIFQRPHEEACDSDDELHHEVARTVRHEIAHHFGIDDDRLDELGAY